MRQTLIILFILFLLVSLSCTSSDNKTLLVKGKIPKNELEKGSQIYRAKCMTCHRKNGEGLIRVYPPLANSDYLKNKLEDAIRMVKYGSGKMIKVNGEKYNGYMPASGLNDKDLSLVFNYILNSWGNEYGRIDNEIVNKIKEKK
ncbi:cytochrome c [Ancylomarina euxinus]|uniref:Cytochrome c n=1 Tax=Ancylomarina euxinus TaxID=2283627 RepID=A0A425Y317_9BACT|nr:cytochrome c [Ancylomarina euxinus]MCZ4693171.1 cytochrome c [Ancylomarina euxinus]MUP15309.1 c-type cytochrome [Ancylomarina euxinus]RRG22562.1 cytochrome c [Ancylomarina euxinus]